MQPALVRVGIPKTGGQLVAAAREAGYPILFSANAFAKVYPPGHERAGDFRGFALPDRGQLEGMDVALDSAGFVAAVKYGDYRWTVEDYMDLAAAYPWTWYASMDLCCEAEVAGDRQLRMLRIAATAQLLGRCNRVADERGIKRPMPVIQGWHAHEYEQCIAWMPLVEWPELVGVGSVCRRQLHGEHGILNIVETLDRILPPHVRLHLFGAKGGALEALGAHRRIAAVDSMAWDSAARRERPTGRDMPFRIQHMQAWAERQREIAQAVADEPAGAGSKLVRLARRRQDGILGPLYDRDALGLPVGKEEELVLEALTRSWADLLLEGQVEYRDAVFQARHDAIVMAAVWLQQPGQALSPAVLDHLEDLCVGRELRSYVERLLDAPDQSTRLRQAA